MRIFQECLVRQVRTKERITDGMLLNAIADAERGLIDADLGGD